MSWGEREVFFDGTGTIKLGKEVKRLKYQVMRDLTQAEYNDLKASVIQHGVLVPIVFDEYGIIIDGHHRKMICDDLHITDFPKDIRTGLTESEKLDMARQLNEARRQLTPEEKAAETRRRLIKTPELSDRQIAKKIGVSPSTVGAARKEMEADGQLSRLDTSIGSDGKEYPRQVERKQPEPIPEPESTDIPICGHTEPEYDNDEPYIYEPDEYDDDEYDNDEPYDSYEDDNESDELDQPFESPIGCTHEHAGCNAEWCDKCKGYTHCCADCDDPCNSVCGWIYDNGWTMRSSVPEPEENIIRPGFGQESEKYPEAKIDDTDSAPAAEKIYTSAQIMDEYKRSPEKKQSDIQQRVMGMWSKIYLLPETNEMYDAWLSDLSLEQIDHQILMIGSSLGKLQRMRDKAKEIRESMCRLEVLEK